ncbi:MAG: molybdenum cofactor guanylyltransferase [Planctomycetota bacterium]
MIAPACPQNDSAPRHHSRLSGAVLVGGASRRMGRPKAQLLHQGRSFLEQILVTLRPFVERLVVVGGASAQVALRGVSPETRANVGWLPDVVDQAGPLAGVVAALQHDHECDWLCIACDMPSIEPGALRWLIDQYRRVDADVVAARMEETTAPEPFPAIYARTALTSLRNVLLSQPRGLRRAMRELNCFAQLPPVIFTNSWSNINTPHDYSALHKAMQCHTGERDECQAHRKYSNSVPDSSDNPVNRRTKQRSARH